MKKCSKCGQYIEKPGYCNKCSRERYQENKDKRRASARKYYENNKEKCALYGREWHKKNPEYGRNQMMKWKRRNPEKAKAIQERYYPKKLIRNLLRQRRLRKLECDWNFESWEDLKRKYNFQCLCCGKYEPEIILTPDHVVPISLGGTNLIDNIQPLCKGCNCKKFTKTTDYRNNV